MTFSKWLSVLAMLVLAALAAAPAAYAAESYDNCTGTISSVPTVISSQGTWCFKQDLATASNGKIINITTNNVTIDCNDFKLDGLSGGASVLSFGISATNQSNITIRNCKIRGFFYGVDLESSSGGGGHVVEDNRFDGNTAYAMLVQGDGSVVRRNRVFNTGGSTLFFDPIGIYATGSVDIVHNTVTGVAAPSGDNGNATGIQTSSNTDGRIIGNSVRGVKKDGTGKTYGIFNVNDHITLRENILVGDISAGSIGLDCSSTHGSANDNVISGFATAISGCTDSGSNDVVP